MDILIKKTSPTSRNSITDKELLSHVDNSSLIKDINLLKEEIKLLKSQPKLDRQLLISLLTNEVINLEPTNFNCSSSIEKLENIPNGTFYYDGINNRFRGKINNNWKSFKQEE